MILPLTLEQRQNEQEVADFSAGITAGHFPG